LGSTGSCPRPDRGLPDRRPPHRTTDTHPGDGPVHRHRGRHRASEPAGDRRWRELLNVHDELARRLAEEFGGQLIKTTGDGILATFDGPGRAIRCATALRDELGGIGVQIRAGLHTGEVELRDGDVGGIAVHIAARVTVAARPGDILTSRTVHDLVVGSDITLLDQGAHRLKGVEGTRQLFMAPRP
jgi:class 3 adenylate cyclase